MFISAFVFVFVFCALCVILNLIEKRVSGKIYALVKGDSGKCHSPKYFCCICTCVCTCICTLHLARHLKLSWAWVAKICACQNGTLGKVILQRERGEKKYFDKKKDRILETLAG